MNCRFCNSKLQYIFADLGKTPLANSYLKSDEINKTETFYPLCTYVCSKCFLVQLDKFEEPKEIFTNYAYLSSYSKTWLNHVQKFAEEAIQRFKIDKNDQIIEIASNDGYLLKNFKKHNIPILGIEPAKNIAKIAKKKKIPTVTKFFGQKTARELVNQNKKADLLIAFNVLPHVPNLKDFVKGLKTLLKQRGVIVIQFSAYLMPLIKKTEFDHIYHEHFSYFSIFTLKKIFSKYNLEIFDIEEQDIHGGSMRVYIKHKNNHNITIQKSVMKKIEEEIKFGMNNLTTYLEFNKNVNTVKIKIWKFFINAKLHEKNIVAYGAAAKGNTMLNYCGVGKEFIDYTVDANPYKQKLYLPGTHIPIHNPKKILRTKPDYVLILAWNFKEEIMKQMKMIKKWKGKFVVLTPKVKIYL